MRSIGKGIGIPFRRGGGQSWSSYWNTLISATVENAAPTNVILTFPTARPTIGASDFSIYGFTISSASWTGSVLTLVLSTAIIYGDSVVVTFIPSGGTANVTNNVAPVGELTAYITGLTTPLRQSYRRAVNKFIVNLETHLAADIAACFDWIYLLYGEQKEASIKNIVKNLHHATDADNIEYTELGGTKSNGSSTKLDTNYNASTQRVAYALNSASIMIYSNTDLAGAEMGVRKASNDDCAYILVKALATGGIGYFPLNIDAVTAADILNDNGLGMFIVSRNVDNSVFVRMNKNTLYSYNVAPTALANFNMYVNAYNSGGTAGYGNNQLALAGAGKGFSIEQADQIADDFLEFVADVDLGRVRDLGIVNMLCGNLKKGINANPRHVYATATHAYWNRTYYFDGLYYLAWMKKDNSVDKMSAMVCTFDGNVFSESQLAIEGVAEEDDSHAMPSIVVDANGYIYISRAHGDGSDEVYIAKSDNPEDITAFTTIQTLTIHYHDYSRFQKIGTDIYYIGRSDAHLGKYAISKKGLLDATFSAPVVFCQMSPAIAVHGYVVSLRNEAEDKIGLACQYLATGGNRTEPRMGYIETVDGITFSNAAGTFSKDVVDDGFITEAEFVTNCILYNPVDTLDHNMCTDGFILNGVPYLLVEEGHNSTTSLDTYVDFTSLTIRYFSGGSWQTAVFPYSGMPFSRQFSEPTRFHFTHDGTNFVMFVWDSTFKTLHKYSSPDLSSWTDNGEIIDLTSVVNREMAFMGSCPNRWDLMQMGLKNITGGDLMVYKY